MNQVPQNRFKKYKRFGLFLRNLDPVEFCSIVDPRPHTCYNCWSPKHELKDCPKPLIDIFCCNCGRRYVKIEECPRCARIFWDLDESAREWLSSYIPEVNQEELADSSEKDSSEYKEDASQSWNKVKINSSKLKAREANFKRDGWTECERTSASISRTKNEDNREDQWWDSSNREDKKIIEKLNPALEKDRTKLDHCKTLPINGRNEYDSESLQAVHMKSDIVVEKQSNLLEKNKHKTAEERLLPVPKKDRAKVEYFKSLSERNEYNYDSNQATNVKAESDFEKQKSIYNSSPIAASDDDEDYDNIIIDEEEQKEESTSEGGLLQDFMDLLKAAKYLPIQQQNTIVLRFASECRKKL